MRLYKSRAEQAALRKSAQVAVGAHRRAMRFVRPGAMEYEVMAEVVHEFRRHNADLAYHPIVGGGANACVMHYRDNDQVLERRRPACCSTRGVNSTITPPTSRGPFRSAADFCPAQRAVYEVVLDAQNAAIDKVRAGNDWNAPHEAAVRAVTQGLVKLGLLKGPAVAARQGQGVRGVLQPPHRPLDRARRA